MLQYLPHALSLICKLSIVSLLLFACASEADVEPPSGGFIRYFSSENNNTAVLAEEAHGGLTLLANVDVQTETGFVKKIKLIHTDINGNYLWDELYPEGDGSMTATSFITLNSGYLIVGDSIKDNATEARRTDLLLLFVDTEGKNPKTVTISIATEADATKALHGRAVVEDANGNFIVLARMEGDGANDMYLASYSSETNSVLWSRKYGAGTSTVISRIFYNSDNVYWAGSILTDSKYDFRVMRATQDSQIALLGNPMGESQFDEIVSDFCDAYGGWAFVGSSDQNGDSDIYFSRVSRNANIIYTRTIPMNGSVDEGNSICLTKENEMVILGTIESGADQRDLYFGKFDIDGNEIWSKTFGGDDDQVGASVRQLSDGSLLVFSSTNFGRSRKLMLLKVSSDGTLQ